MPPRRKQAEHQAADAYKFPSAEKVNNPTSETALGMDPDDIVDQPIPEPDLEELLRYPSLQWNRGKPTDHSRTFGPLYIHDKVSPEQFINLLTVAKKQADMFGDFNGLPEDASAKPYEYNGHWTNRLIRATAQRAMASLLYKDAMRGKVNLIYMDPPYNKSFRSNFQANAETPETEEDWDDLPNDPVAVKAFRDTYRDGVHSYLDGLYEQITLGRELLARDGSFIVQIGADNVHEVVMLMAEVFGRENHVATIPYRTTTNPSTRLLPEIGNWLIWFAKDKENVKYHQIYIGVKGRQEVIDLWQNTARYEEPGKEARNLTREERDNPSLMPTMGKLFTTYPCHSAHTSFTGRSDKFYYHKSDEPCDGQGWSGILRNNAERQPHHDHICNGDECNQPLPENWVDHTCTEKCDTVEGTRLCPKGRKCSPKCQANGQLGRITPGNNIRWKQYEDEIAGRTLNAIWDDSGIVIDKQYVVETPPRVLERCVLMTTDPGDLVLDLTCGSGAMPFQAEKWGRRWIAVDVAQVSIAIARERLITNAYPYHMLKDSLEGARRDHEMEQTLLSPERRKPFDASAADSYGHDPAKGFVVERQRRVSAGTLAYGQGEEKPIYHPGPYPDREESHPCRFRVYRRVRFPIPLNTAWIGELKPTEHGCRDHPSDDRLHNPRERKTRPCHQANH